MIYDSSKIQMKEESCRQEYLQEPSQHPAIWMYIHQHHNQKILGTSPTIAGHSLHCMVQP